MKTMTMILALEALLEREKCVRCLLNQNNKNSITLNKKVANIINTISASKNIDIYIKNQPFKPFSIRNLNIS